MSISLGRKILSQMLTIYLPSILIIVVVYSTNFLKEFFFEATISVNLTAMLVLTTIFLGVSGDLPTTSYIKYVETWLLFCLFVPFIYVLLHIYIDSLRVIKKKNKKIFWLTSYFRKRMAGLWIITGERRKHPPLTQWEQNPEMWSKYLQLILSLGMKKLNLRQEKNSMKILSILTRDLKDCKNSNLLGKPFFLHSSFHFQLCILSMDSHK